MLTEGEKAECVKMKWRPEDKGEAERIDVEDMEKMKGADCGREKKFCCITRAQLQCSLVWI